MGIREARYLKNSIFYDYSPLRNKSSEHSALEILLTHLPHSLKLLHSNNVYKYNFNILMSLKFWGILL